MDFQDIVHDNRNYCFHPLENNGFYYGRWSLFSQFLSIFFNFLFLYQYIERKNQKEQKPLEIEFNLDNVKDELGEIKGLLSTLVQKLNN